MTLEVQLSPRRRRRLQRKIEIALEQAGPPYRRFAAVAHDAPDETTVEIVHVGDFLARLEAATACETVAETREWMQKCLERDERGSEGSGAHSPMKAIIRQSRMGDVFRVYLRPVDRQELNDAQRAILNEMFDSWPEAKAAAEGAFPGCTIEAD